MIAKEMIAGMLGLLVVSAGLVAVWAQSGYSWQMELTKPVLILLCLFAVCFLIYAYGAFKSWRSMKMGLFRFSLFGSKKPKEDSVASPQPVQKIDGPTLYANTKDMTGYLNGVLLPQYKLLINGGVTLTLEQYKMLMPVFLDTAHAFESVYELMRFDMEKLEELQKYSKETAQKREELEKVLQDGPAKETNKDAIPQAQKDMQKS